MKNAEQFLSDMKANEALRTKFREGMNKLRSDATLSVVEAGQRVARELGYEVSDDEAKKFAARIPANGRELTEEEAKNVAGGVQNLKLADLNESIMEVASESKKPTCFTW